MRIFIIISTMLLMSCTNEAVEEVIINEPDNVYIVAGQSNATRCNWGYFENLTGSTVINIGVSGYMIKGLIRVYDGDVIKDTNPAGVIFVHGESDSVYGTNTKEYVKTVEQYRLMISFDAGRDLPLYISTVGYDNEAQDYLFDSLRGAVTDEVNINPLWNIAYNNAQYFRSWDMLVDNVHFTKQGCDVMMENIAALL